MLIYYSTSEYLRSMNAPACLSLTLGAERVFSCQLWASGEEPLAKAHAEDHFFNILTMAIKQICHETRYCNCFWVLVGVRACINGVAVSRTFHLSKLKLHIHSAVTHSPSLLPGPVSHRSNFSLCLSSDLICAAIIVLLCLTHFT